jgi:uncharacterized membrane protein HdeD (DUF308 family)
MPADGQYPRTSNTEKPVLTTQTATQSQSQSRNNPPTILDEVKRRSGWTMAMGILTTALGVVLIVYPFATATATTVFLGSIMTLAGVAELLFALNSQTAGSFFFQIILAVLFGFTGIMLVAYPFQGAEGLTLFVGSLLIARGIVAGVAGFKLRPLDGWGWFVADAVASIAAGGYILYKWPSSTAWAIGTLVGASVVMTGIARAAFAARIRQGATDVQRAVQGNASSCLSRGPRPPRPWPFLLR